MVLVGIVVGAALASRVVDRSRSRAFVFGMLQVLTALSVLTLMLLPAAVWRGAGEGLWIYFIALLPPAVFSGASFPLAVRMVVERPAGASAGADGGDDKRRDA